MQKKLFVAVVALCLCMCCLIGVTVAWLTSESDTVTNTFTYGKVEITLDEADTDGSKTDVTTEGRDIANKYHLIPGSTYDKDPTVHVKAGSEACYVFVRVNNGLKDIVDPTTIEAQIIANGWKALVDANNDDIADDGVYYQEVSSLVNATVDTNLVVFENFKVNQNADVAAYGNATITVTAYAIQAENFADAEEAWENAPETWKQ